MAEPLRKRGRGARGGSVGRGARGSRGGRGRRPRAQHTPDSVLVDLVSDSDEDVLEVSADAAAAETETETPTPTPELRAPAVSRADGDSDSDGDGAERRLLVRRRRRRLDPREAPVVPVYSGKVCGAWGARGAGPILRPPSLPGDRVGLAGNLGLRVAGVQLEIRELLRGDPGSGSWGAAGCHLGGRRAGTRIVLGHQLSRLYLAGEKQPPPPPGPTIAPETVPPKRGG